MLLFSILHLQSVPRKPTPQHVPKLLGPYIYIYIPTSYSIYMYTHMSRNYSSVKSKSIIPFPLQAFSLLADPVIN